MNQIVLLALVLIYFTACRPGASDQAAEKGLRKIYYHNNEEIEQLRNAGAEIVVQQSDYVIVRTNNMVTALSVESEKILEQDLVQRLVTIQLQDSTVLQKVADIGIDIWQIKDDKVLGRAYDIHLERLEKAGLSYQILENDAREWKAEK